MKRDPLKLKEQICFPMYACSREMIKKYRPYLEAIGLTYTQYIAMIVLWEAESISVKELGRELFLDSGTLTPVLKSLESKGLITRHRSSEDERVLIASITDSGMELRERAEGIPAMVCGCARLSPEERDTLRILLNKLLGRAEEE